MKAELSFLFLLGFLGKKYSLDIGKNTTLRDSDTSEQFVQLFVISDGQLKVTENDSCLFVVTSSVSSQLKDLSTQILKHRRQVHCEKFGGRSRVTRHQRTSSGNASARELAHQIS